MKALVLVFLMSVASPSQGAIPSSSQKRAVTKDVKTLRSIAFNKDHVLATRWKAFSSLVKIQGKKSLPDIQKAVTHKEWFMRDVGIKSLMLVSPKKARVIAEKLLKLDPSLIVRTSAVEVLKLLKSTGSSKKLWLALEDKKNFRGKQSLWIRPRIVLTLIDLKNSNLSRYGSLFDERDSKLQKLAVHAFEKFSQHKAQYKSQKTSYKVAYWKSWWSNEKIN